VVAEGTPPEQWISSTSHLWCNRHQEVRMFAHVCLLALLACRSAGPTPIRFERLRDNAQAWIDAHPDDARGYEVLGRAHLYAYSSASDYANAPPLADEPAQGLITLIGIAANTRYAKYPPAWSKVAFRFKQWSNMGHVPWAPSAAESLEHVTAAIRNLRRAVELDPNSASAQLALAFTLDHCAHVAPMLDSPALFALVGKKAMTRDEWKAWDDWLADEKAFDPSALLLDGIEQWCAENWVYLEPLRVDPRPLVQRRASVLLSQSWTSLALVHYRAAFELAAPADAKLNYVERRLASNDYREQEVISFEAGDAIQTILLRFHMQDPAVRGLWDRLDVHLNELKSLGPRPRVGVSPLVISFSRSGQSDMVAREAHMCFDMDGKGDMGPWTWVRPDTAFVVWDPTGRGRIASGRDFFGEGTFGLFPRDGFAALSLLDDDHDGWVSGRELAGVRLWFDLDSDGHSTTREVRDLTDFGIVALRCTDGVPVADGIENPDGVKLASGDSVPLFDWIAHPSRLADEECGRPR
jgi:hypothetical protein